MGKHRVSGRLPAGERLERIERSPQYRGGRFHNPVPRSTQPSLRMALRLLPRWLLGRQKRIPSARLPTRVLNADQLNTFPPVGWRATWLGHSSCLLELGGKRVLTDPVWSERVSPFSFAGPTRFHEPPIALSDLPPLDAVLISHDHYDHLDMATVCALATTRVRFVVPLGVGSHLESWGVDPAQIQELDWWESHRLADSDVEIVATPAHHLSGRAARTGRDATLWASFVIRSATDRLYFGGDTGRPADFAEIGRRFGPFDLTVLPIGAYGEHWPDIHLTPEEAVSAFAELGGKLLLPIHWGTFNLAFHAWHEPPVRLIHAASVAGVSLAMPLPGQTFTAHNAPPGRYWNIFSTPPHDFFPEPTE